MNGEQIWLVVAAGGALALVLLVASALLWRVCRRLTTRIAELEAGLAEQSASTPKTTDAAVAVETAAYVITAMNEPQETPAVPARIDGALFADIVARETAIKAAGLAHGLRKALSPEVRNRIRFQMKREVKRSRKQRRADLKAALRDFQARERSGMAGEDAA